MVSHTVLACTFIYVCFILRFKPACNSKPRHSPIVVSSFLTFILFNTTSSHPNWDMSNYSGLSTCLFVSPQNTSGSLDPDSLNQLPFTGRHTTTTTTSTITTTSTSTSPSCSVRPPVSPHLQGGKYSSSSNSSHPAMGENISPGSTARDQGLRLGVETARKTSGGKVNVMCTFQQMFENAKIAFDRINFHSNSLIDRAQIDQFENMYRELDFYINSLIPHVGFDLDIQGIIYAMRNLQIKLEDSLVKFYQNLPEREQVKIIFTLPHFQNGSFLQAINRSLQTSKSASVSQGSSNIANSPPRQDSSFLANSPKEKFSPSKTSTPNKVKNFEINKSRENVDNHSLERNEDGNSFKSNSSTKIKAKFDIFLRRKSEVEDELEELLSCEKNDIVQPATLK